MKRFVLILIVLAMLFCPAKQTKGTPIPIATEDLLGHITDNSTFWPTQYSAISDCENNTVYFQITFNRTPDFFTLDQYLRQAESFQFYIDTDAVWPYPGEREVETIIRGEEIHIDGDVRVRDESPHDPNPGPHGGWGPIRGSVTYSLDDLTLTFDTSFDLINESDGWFSYQLLLSEYGAGGASMKGHSNINYVVPEPATILLIGTGFIGIAGLGRKRFKK